MTQQTLTVSEIGIRIKTPTADAISRYISVMQTTLYWYGCSRRQLEAALTESLIVQKPRFLRDLLLMNLCGGRANSAAVVSFDFLTNPESFTVTRLPYSMRKRCRLTDTVPDQKDIVCRVTAAADWPAFGPDRDAGRMGASPYFFEVFLRGISELLGACVETSSFRKVKLTTEGLLNRLKAADEAVLSLASPITATLPSEVVATHMTSDCLPLLTEKTGTKCDAQGRVISRTTPKPPGNGASDSETRLSVTRGLLEKEVKSAEDFMTSYGLARADWRGLDGKELRQWAEGIYLDSFCWIEFTDMLGRLGYARELAQGCFDLRVEQILKEFGTMLPIMREFRDAYLKAGCPALTNPI